MKEFFKKYFKWIVLFVCLIGFLALAEDVFHKEIMKGDIIGYELVSRFLIGDVATPVAKVITQLGGAIFLITLTIILILFIKNKKIGISIFSNLAIITVLNQILKRILQRPRPTEFRIIEEAGYSFPSGHSMVSMLLDIEAKKAAIFLDSGQNAASETPYCRERPSRRKSSCRKVRPFCSFVVCRE